MKKKNPKTTPTVAYVKEKFSPKVPCVNADKEGYCTGPCEGSLCIKCESYQPVKPAPAEPDGMYTTALTVPMDKITFPPGLETLGDKANWLHACSVELSKRSTAAAILAGWVLSVARSTCAHGQWLAWLSQNVSFHRTTADNYMHLYEQTIGAARAAARRPVALAVEPTMKELEAAAHDVDGKSLSALYKSTRLIAAPGNWGGAREGAGRKAEAAAAAAESGDGLDMGDSATLMWAEAMKPFEANRAAFHAAARDLNVSVAGKFLEELSMLADALRDRVEDGGAKSRRRAR